MNIDDVLTEYEQGLEAKRLVERCSDECLAFADLAAEGLSHAALAHVTTCERCRMLREKLLGGIAADDDGFGFA